ncbi:hypothetical protein EDD85DRAFT_789670 [Armillaria nabsnona]|nr:hypothetical protein EDD85DRAFT_789670 [Armillaria nabsnona]
MFSVPCEKGVTSCAKDSSGKRGCHVEKKCTEVLDSINVQSVSFVGMDEDVRPFFAYANQVTYVASKGRIGHWYIRNSIAHKHSVVPRLVIIASDVHYWMTIKKDVIASVRILVKFSDKDYYCTRDAQRSLRLIPATPRSVFASTQCQLSERRILFLECPTGDARCNISSAVSSQSLVDYGYDFALRSMIFMARAPFRGPGKEVGSSEDERQWGYYWEDDGFAEQASWTLRKPSKAHDKDKVGSIEYENTLGMGKSSRSLIFSGTHHIHSSGLP